MALTFGFDLGTKTGFALHDGERVSVVQTIDYSSKIRGKMWKKVRASFLDLIIADKDSLVVFESVHRHIGTEAAHVYGGFLAVLQMVAAENDVPCIGVGVGVLKKFATGKGNASKEEMMVACMSKLGKQPRNDNAADAAWIAEYGAKILRRKDGSIIQPAS